MRRLLPATFLSFLSLVLMVGLVSFFSAAPEVAHASTLGPNNPSTGTNVSLGNNAWSSPGNITSSDDTYASAPYSNSTDTDNLQGTGYGFSIPAGATINGITVSVERHYTGPGVAIDSTRLVKAGVAVGSSKAGGVWPLSDATATYGSSSDLWGTTWTATDVNASNFGVLLGASDNTVGSSGTAFVDTMTITVTYTVASTVTSVTSDAVIFE